MIEKQQKKPDIGGQAVIEGVMMKSPDAIAIAVRRANGDIKVEREPYVPLSKKHPWMGWPVVRGAANMVSMLAMGMKTIEKSTKMLGLLDEEPSKFEKWLADKLGKDIDKIVMGVAMVLAVLLSLLLFMVLPSVFASWANRHTDSLLVVNLVSGIVRIVILIAYIGLSGLIPDMRRTYEYHGAEHMTVHCYENDMPLTPECAMKFSPLHPRCGTSFLLLVMVIAILFGAVMDQLLQLAFGIERLSFLLRLGRSLLFFPLIAGLSYEALKGLAHQENIVVRAIRWPGLMLQRLTTRRPNEDQLEVAIAAFNAALTGVLPPEKSDAPEETMTPEKDGEAADDPAASAD
ncbi:MAG: DUF1385 domain-containing protein [Clostridia bacterium]|nr:DUF1385 domain-containing protein [Clostridia bacterium]